MGTEIRSLRSNPRIGSLKSNHWDPITEIRLPWSEQCIAATRWLLLHVDCRSFLTRCNHWQTDETIRIQALSAETVHFAWHMTLITMLLWKLTWNLSTRYIWNYTLCLKHDTDHDAVLNSPETCHRDRAEVETVHFAWHVTLTTMLL